MATRLIQIVSATNVPAGGTVVIPHSVNDDGTAVIPDWIGRDNMGFTGVSCTTAAVTVRNDTSGAASVNLYLFYDHTIQRVFGSKATLQLTPAPFWIGGSASQVIPAAATVPPQQLITPNYAASGVGVTADNDLALADIIGYAWRDFAVGEVFTVSWRMSLAGVAITWGELALATATFVSGAASINLTPVGFADVAASMVSSSTNFTSTVTLTNAVTAGSALYGVVAAANTNTAPQVVGGAADQLGTSIMLSKTTAGWRPSLNLGVASAFAKDSTHGLPKQVWSATP